MPRATQFQNPFRIEIYYFPCGYAGGEPYLKITHAMRASARTRKKIYKIPEIQLHKFK
jgi:hypothetical protein